MKIAKILIGALALVALPAMAGASVAPGGDRGATAEATPAGSIHVADVGCDTCTSGFDIWQTFGMDRGTRLNQRRRHNGGRGSGRQRLGDRPGWERCGGGTIGCRPIDNPDGGGKCLPLKEGGWMCPDPDPYPR